MAIKITDGTDHVAVEFSAGADSRVFLPKGQFYLKRYGNDFLFIPYVKGADSIVRCSYGTGEKYDEVDTTAPVHASADALETALLLFIFS